jgi:hypothetical protein
MPPLTRDEIYAYLAGSDAASRAVELPGGGVLACDVEISSMTEVTQMAYRSLGDGQFMGWFAQGFMDQINRRWSNG